MHLLKRENSIYYIKKVIIMTQKRILYIGAHPDDADILCGGTAIKLARAGHLVKFVSATNGDTGHHIMSRAETARVRKQEAINAGKYVGLVEYQVLDHDCGLEPTVENRREFVRIIREFAPDVLISHRLCDYHPDHRATAQLVQDCAYVCMVPHFVEDVPIPDKAPIFAFSYDKFVEPRPHRADAAIEIDSVAEDKITAMANHKSQFFEWLPWAGGDRNFDGSKLSEQEKRDLIRDNYLIRQKIAADANRDRLIAAYGEEKGSKIVYAETFEQSPYSRTVSNEEFQALLEP